MSDAEKLNILNHSGFRVADDGRVSSWLDQPPQNPRPIGQRDGTSVATRRRFTAQEDEMLTKWCGAAESEGIKGNCVFEQFETVVRLLCSGLVFRLDTNHPTSYQIIHGRHIRTDGARYLNPPIPNQRSHQTSLIHDSTTQIPMTPLSVPTPDTPHSSFGKS